MRRIPFEGERDGVLSNLVPATRVQMARAGGAEIVAPSHLPATLDELDLAFRALFAYASELGIPADEQAYFVDRLLLLLTPARSVASPSMSTRAGGSSPAPRRGRPPTASSWPTGLPAPWSPPRRAR